MTDKLQYLHYAGEIDAMERQRVRSTDLYKRGDTILVWVNEGEILMRGERVDLPASAPLEPQRGCICPPTAEQTCQGLSCPRRGIRAIGF